MYVIVFREKGQDIMSLKISNEEFKNRIKNTQLYMKKENMDFLLCYGNEAEPQFVRYYSDYWPSFESAGVLIPVEGKPALLIGPESKTYAESNSRITEIYRLLAFRESSEPEYPGIELDSFDSVIKIISPDIKCKKVGIAGYSLITKVIYDELEHALRKIGDVEIVKADLLVSKLRAIKTDNEIMCMKEAYRISEEALKRVIDGIHIGMTENQLKGLAMAEIYKQGGEGEAYPFWIITGKDTNQAISRCRNKVIEEGDVIQIQIGTRYEGYASTIGRPVIVGKATEKQKQMIEAALELQKALLKTIKPGINAHEVAKIQQDVISKYKLEHCILYGPCHGTGLMEGEYPWIELNSNFLLEKNMTFATCLYLGDDEEKIGIRIEDGFLITEEGTESFSNYRRELIEI